MNWRKKVTTEEEKKEILAMAMASSLQREIIQPEKESISTPVEKESIGGLYRPPMAHAFGPNSVDQSQVKPDVVAKPAPKSQKKESCNIDSARDFPALGASKKSKKQKKAMQVDAPSMKDSDDMEISKPSWIEIAKKGEMEETIRKELELLQKEEQEKAKNDSQSQNKEYNSLSEYMDIVNKEHFEYTGYHDSMEDPDFVWDDDQY